MVGRDGRPENFRMWCGAVVCFERGVECCFGFSFRWVVLDSLLIDGGRWK